MFHQRWYWIVVCSASLLVTGCGGKKSAEVIKDESQKSVVLISHLKGHGSGFFIEGEAGVCTVLTAKHVVPEGSDISLQTMMSKLPWKPLNIRRAENVDLAVVTFKPLDGNCPFSALKLGDSNNMALTKPIHISSYPGGVNGKAPKQSFYISSVSDKTPGGADGYEMGYKTDTQGGTSGSPVLNEFGEVIAVHGRSYMNKDSNSNDRAYLDLGVPINVYKQSRISKGDIAELKPGDSEHFFQAGRSKQKLGKNEEAISDYDRAIQLNPNYDKAYNNRGVAKYRSGKNEEAISDYDRAIQLNPNDAFAYNNRGNAKSALGKKEEAISDYDRAIQLNPNYDKAYNNRGVAKYRSGKNEEAISDYDRAIKLNPNYAATYNNRGNAKSDLGKKEAAKGDYQTAAELYLKQGNKASYQDAVNAIKNLGV